MIKILTTTGRLLLVQALRVDATVLEARSFHSMPDNLRNAADEIEALSRVINKRKLKRLKKKGKL